LKAKEIALFLRPKSFFCFLEDKVTAASAPDDYIVVTDSDEKAGNYSCLLWWLNKRGLTEETLVKRTSIANSKLERRRREN
jgi:hypothetical protein